MIKRLLSLLLCLILAVAVLASCGPEDENDKGAYIKMYLADQIYDLDPLFALNNKSAEKIISLTFAGLFRIDENGKVKNDLVKSYKITEDDNAKEYKMILTLNTTYWSDGIPVDAADVIYAWKRILDVENYNPAAALLFDIKNARAVVEGDCSIDDLGVTDPDSLVLEITFERKINYDQFILNLTSPALVPLREDIVEKNDDWAKKPATIVCSGPFTLRGVQNGSKDDNGNLVWSMILERNPYYFRDKNKDVLDKSVTPYRLVIDFSLTDEEIKQKYDDGEIFYVGEIPLSLRDYYADSATVADEMSTHVYYLNEKALIANGGEGEYLFANEAVRNSLSLAINRDEIAAAVVFAKAATGLVPYGVFDSTSSKNLFREAGGAILATGADQAAAKASLAAAGIDPSKYSFSISVRAEDEVHVLIAEMVQTAWQALGFNVTLNQISAIVNDDINKLTEEVAADIMDDIYNENIYAGTFEVIALDLVSPSPDAFSILAPFAKKFAGQALDMTTLEYKMLPHITGFDNEEYNALIEQLYEETDIAARAALLHDAEELLLSKMPVIPIIFNQDAYVISKDLSNYSTSYYQNRRFAKLKLKNYELYIETTVEETTPETVG